MKDVDSCWLGTFAEQGNLLCLRPWECYFVSMDLKDSSFISRIAPLYKKRRP
jgi:hypothetical protein